jgi:hypothetical protein
MVTCGPATAVCTGSRGQLLLPLVVTPAQRDRNKRTERAARDGRTSGHGTGHPPCPVFRR